jgi:uncharacterized protein (DUF4415 family)
MVTKPDPYFIDDENPAWSDEQLARAIERRAQKRGQIPVKQAFTLNLDRDVIEKFKASGAGWQTLINETLRNNVPA